MGEHADDTMSYDDEPGDHIVGDGDPQDVAIMGFVTGLGATPRQIREGFAFQNSVMRDLGLDWIDSRTMIFDRRSLDRARDRSYLSYLESVQGDLTDRVRGTTMECQTGVSNPHHVSWEHSKRVRSKADWQCFGFTTGLRLVVRTDAIRAELDRWDAKPQESLRDGGGPYYSFGEAFLRKVGAIEFDVWLKQYQA
jgi:hypothetical protein